MKASSKSYGYCFGCGIKGSALSIAYEWGRYTADYSAVDYVKRCENGLLDYEFMPYEVVRPVSWGCRRNYNVIKDKVVYLDELIIAPYVGKIPNYVIERGISFETANLFRLGYDAFKNNLIIPIYDVNDRLVGYSKRNIVFGGYFHSKGFKRNLYLFGENLITPGGSIILVEGFFDVMKLVQYGYRSLALMGSELSNEQLSKLIDLVGDGVVYIMMDGDKPGWEAADKIANLLEDSNVEYSIIKLAEGFDPDDLSKEELENIL